MQAHYHKVKTGKDTSQFTEIQQRNMQYGREHEIYGIAIVAARLILAMFHPLNTVKGVKPFQMVQLTIPR